MLAIRYGVPGELIDYVNDGLLELLSADKDCRTVVFHMPSRRWKDRCGRIATYTLTWIHPQFNARFCHYYEQVPGHLPNFWVAEDTTDAGEEIVPDIETMDELECWLEEFFADS